MDIKEKLVELFYENNVICDQKIEGLADDVMDIISNVVTVQEWHSVNECMPEDLEENKGKKVINCIVEHDSRGNGKTTTQFRQRKYDSYYKEWCWSKIGGCTVMRWTMMPQPPKGE